jgi:predicted nuclease of predicted toxin-antitoxin system
MDVHIPATVTNGLRLRGVDVLTAQEDERRRLVDPLLLDRAAELGRVMFSFDDDMLAEAARRQRGGVYFAGLVHVRPMRIGVGECVRDLELLAKVYVPEEMENKVEYLPLR